ncbi:GNAT family N-acetyltransferase [Micromonospora sp. NBC_00421]|uniref:GNAT family N-acetyltransferase n=1 Tax=Micromonospora sp. NBC_00421 TaxID=2975976 RepID=UPI002E248D92
MAAEELTDTTFALQAYAFMSSPWEEAQREAFHKSSIYRRTATCLVVEEAGRIVACAEALPMRQNLRGTVHPMAGVASVASHPGSRRKGHVRALLNRLLRQMRDQGCLLSTLYPFRPSFYQRFGYVGLPRKRTACLQTPGLRLAGEVPGTVSQLDLRDGFPEYTALTHELLRHWHGFAVFDEVQWAARRENPPQWLALACVDGAVVGALTYRITGFGGDLVGDDLLTTGPLGRALLLQFLARHVDQVKTVSVTVAAGELAELWDTDLEVTETGRVALPGEPAPMGRLLRMDALDGMPCGTGDVTVQIVDDELIGGTHRLVGERGTMLVEQTTRRPTAVLTVAGLSGLAYGVLDPVDINARQLGTVDPESLQPLRRLFPRASPYLFSTF